VSCAVARLPDRRNGLTRVRVVIDCLDDCRVRPDEPGPHAAYSPRAFATISLAIDSGTSLYAWNCIEYVARP
jgi:hypothetical protein